MRFAAHAVQSFEDIGLAAGQPVEATLPRLIFAFGYARIVAWSDFRRIFAARNFSASKTYRLLLRRYHMRNNSILSASYPIGARTKGWQYWTREFFSYVGV